MVAALAAKYTRPEDRQYLPDADPDFDVVYALRPRSAMAWRLDDYAASQRRWSADQMAEVAALLAAYDEQIRPAETANLPAGVHAERDGPIVRVVGQYRGFISSPAELALDGEALDALIARQRDFFAARGEAVEWKTRGHDRPADLADRLRAAGFVPEPQETVLIGLAEQLAGHHAPLPPGVSIRPTTEPADLRRVAALESEVWREDWSWLADDLIGRVQADRAEVFIAEAGGQVVSAAWLAYEPGTEFAGLWGGSTLPEWRGKGIYRALVARRAMLAVARGIRYLQVDASEDSRPILERLGLVAVTTTTPYVWTPLADQRLPDGGDGGGRAAVAALFQLGQDELGDVGAADRQA